jgi:hypothetical protein
MQPPPSYRSLRFGYAHLHCNTPALAGGARERSAAQVSQSPMGEVALPARRAGTVRVSDLLLYLCKGDAGCHWHSGSR